LLAAVPKFSLRKRGTRLVSRGEPPDLANLPQGCVFAPRCAYATDRCWQEAPQLREVEGGVFVSCHRAESLTLKGIEVR